MGMKCERDEGRQEKGECEIKKKKNTHNDQPKKKKKNVYINARKMVAKGKAITKGVSHLEICHILFAQVQSNYNGMLCKLELSVKQIYISCIAAHVTNWRMVVQTCVCVCVWILQARYRDRHTQRWKPLKK